ncbi:MAG: ferrous iron transport protein A [Rhodospirillales bacterium]|nr:ferrous iron transport protein A [Rhodospirillales bacterium]
MKLSDLRVGDAATVTGFAAGSHGYRARLMAMGLTPGTRFRLKRLAPLGDPVEIEVRGFSLSLRRAEADVIEVKREV